MADFHKALDFTLQQERKYSNVPGDSGGETWKGIARKKWPDWEGWVIVDRAKLLSQNLAILNTLLSASKELQVGVEAFYCRNFWLPKYDQIADQGLCTKLFDWGVNMGIPSAVKCLQRALAECGCTLEDDGAFGLATLDMTNSANPQDLMPQFIAAAKSHYRAIVEKVPTDVKFLDGWLARADRLPWA
jgi:lysozyme family protein